MSLNHIPNYVRDTLLVHLVSHDMEKTMNEAGEFFEMLADFFFFFFFFFFH